MENKFINAILNIAKKSKFKETELNETGTYTDSGDGNIHKRISIETGTFTDLRDGKTYKTIKIGNQTWMAENFAYKLTSNSWAYGYDLNNVNIYGYLYNWETAKKVCPKGWHLPSDNEWQTLIDYFGGKDVAGGKLKSTVNWNSPNTGATDESGFKALPGGSRIDGIFHKFGVVGYWWSSSESDTSNACYYTLSSDYATVFRHHDLKEDGFSVRYVRDLESKSTQSTEELLEKVDPSNIQEVLNLVLISLKIPSDIKEKFEHGYCNDSKTLHFRGNLDEIGTVLLKDENIAEFISKYNELVNINPTKKEWLGKLWSFFDYVSPFCRKVLLNIDSSNWNQDETYYIAYFKEIIFTRIGEDQFDCELQKRAVQLPT